MIATPTAGDVQAVAITAGRTELGLLFAFHMLAKQDAVRESFFMDVLW